LLNWRGAENAYEIYPDEYSLHLNENLMMEYIKEEMMKCDFDNMFWWMISKLPKQKSDVFSKEYYDPTEEKELDLELLDYTFVNVNQELYKKIQNSGKGLYTKNIEFSDNVVNLSSVMNKPYYVR